MILSNISTPLLGLVDTAVLGHLNAEQFLGAVALGGLIFSFIFWGFAFLRMGTTGLTAQAFGEANRTELNSILIRALTLALIISSLVLLSQKIIAEVSFFILESSSVVEQMALQYFEIRIWSTPATLGLYVLMGWLLGQQRVRIALLIVLITNISNICLDLLFVYHLNMQVAGVALASVIAEYTGFIVALAIVLGLITKRLRYKNEVFWNWSYLANINKFKNMLVINNQIFIRTWCLIFAFAFFTAQSAKISEMVLAVNAVLLNFQMFMAYALDGFANAAEALVGKAVGAKNKLMLRQAILTTYVWSLVVAILFACFYLQYGLQVIDLLTSLEAVRAMAYEFLPWLIFMPLVSFMSYFFDGVFIGAMMTRQMSNTMMFSLFAVFLPVWYFTQSWGNEGLWLAMTLFMVARSLSMAIVFKRAKLGHFNKPKINL
jgi:MATE family multidrug resistance protein